MTAMHISSAIPLLRIFSEEKAREFYVGYLGFTVDWEHRFHADMPLYLQIRRDDLVLHLTEHYGDTTPGTTVFIPLHGIETLHAELAAKPYRYARPGVEKVDWGRELTLTDPFGNRLRFCEQSHG
jgi:catechol 2,3-dioxygenase-like lactoylglutathione lyase family enzyme